MSLLHIESLGFGFRKNTLFEGLHLDMNAGERLTLAGRSGCGKSTLLKLIAGLEKPKTGSIHLNGTPASTPGHIHTAPWDRPIQMVFQDLGLWPSRSVRQHLEDTLQAQGKKASDSSKHIDQTLGALGLSAVQHQKPAKLSGGEARRLGFARALVTQPALLLLDEPYASLDPLARKDGFQYLESTLAVSNTAVILVTHHYEEAAALGGPVRFLRPHGLSEAIDGAELADPNRFHQELTS